MCETLAELSEDYAYPIIVFEQVLFSFNDKEAIPKAASPKLLTVSRKLSGKGKQSPSMATYFKADDDPVRQIMRVEVGHISSLKLPFSFDRLQQPLQLTQGSLCPTPPPLRWVSHLARS